MTDALDPRSALEAAQEAAGAGDYDTAERLLREAAAMQEATLGSQHPELATTLNNLALVCERTNKLADAERGYRRAHAIAVASLAPGHPLIATSLKNLLDFCASRGIPVWAPPNVESASETSSPTFAPRPEPELAFKPEVKQQPAVRVEPQAQARVEPPAQVRVAPPAPARVQPPAQVRAESPEKDRVEPASQKRGSPARPIAAATIGVLAALAVIFFIVQRGGPADPPAPASEVSPTATSPAPAPAPTPAPPTPIEEPAPVDPPPPPPETETTIASASSAPITVLTARLCSALEKQGSPDWECTPVNGAGEPGTFSFYTRLQTSADTTVEHRWYQDERLHQRMRLRVRANQGSGYRTYSSNTVSADRAGSWKVELRDAGGALLQEERFVVR